jgi:NAD(P)-dependent dehydrogenase (short-subunit alcohol dehydrogenase family)
VVPAGRALDDPGVVVNPLESLLEADLSALPPVLIQGGSAEVLLSDAELTYIPIPLSTAYCTTKAAVWMASECLRAELAPHKIDVTAICPGFINTSFYADARHLGATAAKAEQLRTASDGAAKKVAHDPYTVARAIVRAVHTNPAIQPVTVEAKLGYALSRLSPGLVRLGARLAKTDGPMGNAARFLPGGTR